MYRKLSGSKKSLLSNPDRAYDIADNGGMGKTMEGNKPEQGTET